MNLYDTTFNVNYNIIYTELLKTKKENPDDFDEEDINILCTNLYQHQLCCVFYAKNLLDDKIDIGLEEIYKYLMESDSLFSLMINELKLTYKINITNLVVMMLFSENLFYLTHQYICSSNELKKELISNLKYMLVSLIKEKFQM